VRSQASVDAAISSMYAVLPDGALVDIASAD
jgi:hypothetical protein